MEPARRPQSRGKTYDLMALWAKSKSDFPEQQGYHPLLYHLFDVASVAGVLWDRVLTATERRTLADDLGLSEGEARQWVTFLAGIHDLGKCCPEFQLKEPKAYERLEAAGLPVKPIPGKAPHGSVTALELERWLGARGMAAEQAETVAAAVGGHHGIVPSWAEIADMHPEAVGKRPWSDLRGQLISVLAKEIGLPAAMPNVDQATALWLAGYISVVDWIGSNQAFFPFAAPEHAVVPTRDPDYRMRSRERAESALSELGWFAQPPSDARQPSFEDMFPVHANGMQQAVVDLEDRLDEPSLVIIEAPMGSGKTEAALWLAERWAARLGQRGFYVALPTQATSDQMFDRVSSYLRRRYPADAINVQLLHGHASLSEAFAELKQQEYRLFQPSDVNGSEDGGAVAAAEWFTHRKRGLLAPFGVGTIDQVLLSVLQTKHFFVRLFGLAGKTVILDEIHAYDVYMSVLVERLLQWLAALGSSVVLLSATLPDGRRRALADAYMRGLAPAGDPPEIPAASYPRITAVGELAPPFARSVPSGEHSKTLRLEWVEPLLEYKDGALLLGLRLKTLLEDGGTVAVICNTVAHAQRVYRALRPHFPGTASDGDPELDLLHARFLYKDRAEREKRTLRRFGKRGAMVDGRDVQRPERAILISTQIIEQSLDLDFDLMVTELAPIDLVLQRAGRLGRHHWPERPEAPLDGRSLWIVRPESVEDGVPRFDRGSETIYFPHVLLRTWLVLKDEHALDIPGEIEPLIESVYEDGASVPEDAVLAEHWQKTWDDMRGAAHEAGSQAAIRYIKAPETVEHLSQIIVQTRSEEEPELHPASQALTRLTEPSVTVIVLEQVDGAPVLGGRRYQPEQPPDWTDIIQLLRHSVSLGDKRVYWELARQRPPKSWEKSALLSHYRLLPLSGGQAQVGKHTLTVDPDLGVIVDKLEEEE